jgi:predicted nucleic acid-binding protein
MARSRTRSAPAREGARLTVDASVFVNAFNPHEAGHAASLGLLQHAHDEDVPVIVPSLLLVEVASAIARVTGASEAARHYAESIAALAHVMVVAVTAALARDAAAIAAGYRLRGADALYVAVARRYATALVTRDEEQRRRAAAVVPCITPDAALRTARSGR